MSPKKAVRRRKKKEPESRGLKAPETLENAPPAAVQALVAQITDDGGAAVGAYREPLGGHWQVLAVLPVAKVEPTPYQRDLSEAHVKRLSNAIDQLDRFLDPLVAIRTDEGKYWTPNGNHRLASMKALGAKAITALVVPEAEVAHRILLLNTEKAHNLREKSLEVIRLAQGLAEIEDRPEKDFEAEFEEASLLTLGLCYQENGRFSGAVYNSVLRKTEVFEDLKLSKSLAMRAKHAKRVLELNGEVERAVKTMKDRGFDSPYLKAFVVARINPLRFSKRTTHDFDETFDKMFASLEKFDPSKVKSDQVARAGGPPEESA